MRKRILLILGIVIIFTFVLYVKQSGEQAELFSRLNSELQTSYSRVVGSMESIHQNEKLTVPDMVILKANIDFFWGQLELFIDSPSYVTGKINFDIVTAYLAFRRISGDLLELMNNVQADSIDLAPVKERIDTVYTHIKDMNDITTAGEVIRENW